MTSPTLFSPFLRGFPKRQTPKEAEGLGGLARIASFRIMPCVALLKTVFCLGQSPPLPYRTSRFCTCASPRVLARRARRNLSVALV